MTEDEYMNATDAATIRAAIKALSDFSGGNNSVSTAMRLLRDEEFRYFEKLRRSVEKTDHEGVDLRSVKEFHDIGVMYENSSARQEMGKNENKGMPASTKSW